MQGIPDALRSVLHLGGQALCSLLVHNRHVYDFNAGKDEHDRVARLTKIEAVRSTLKVIHVGAVVASRKRPRSATDFGARLARLGFDVYQTVGTGHGVPTGRDPAELIDLADHVMINGRFYPWCVLGPNKRRRRY